MYTYIIIHRQYILVILLLNSINYFGQEKIE